MEVRSRKVKVFAHNLEVKAYLLGDVTTYTINDQSGKKKFIKY